MSGLDAFLASARVSVALSTMIREMKNAETPIDKTSKIERKIIAIKSTTAQT